MEKFEDLTLEQRALRYKKFKEKLKIYKTPKNYSIWVSLIMANFLSNRVQK